MACAVVETETTGEGVDIQDKQKGEGKESSCFNRWTQRGDTSRPKSLLKASQNLFTPIL